MADYVLYGTGASLFAAYGARPMAAARLYSTPTEAGFVNADGSQTFIYGTGFVWDGAAGRFTGGTATDIDHYRDGAFVDGLRALAKAMTALQDDFETLQPSPLEARLLGGDDVLDAGVRASDVPLPARLTGYAGNDSILGGSGPDTLNGGSGNDVIRGRGGDDLIMGHIGADSLYGEDGNDVIVEAEAGAPANDYLSGGAGNDILIAGAGDDTIDGGTGEDVIAPGTGDDFVYSGPDIDIIAYASAWRGLRARYDYADYAVTIDAADGYDTIYAARRIAADDGLFYFDLITARWQKIAATSGLELLYSNRVVAGGTGTDALSAAVGAGSGIVVKGQQGNDRIEGGELALGGTGDDVILKAERAYGETGNDRITGARYADGGQGNDTIWATAANTADRFVGGAGDDVFGFKVNPANSPSGYSVHGTDTIADFALGQDRIDIAFGAGVGAAGREIVMTQSGADTLIAYAGGILVLERFDSSGVTLDDILV